MNERDIRRLTHIVDEQNEAVPYFKNEDDPHRTAEMIVEEAQELVEELEKAFVTDDLTQVAGELGDVLYLALKFASSLGIEAEDAIVMKVERNKRKYGLHIDGKQAKEEWDKMGGDTLFYQMYLDSIADLD